MLVIKKSYIARYILQITHKKQTTTHRAYIFFDQFDSTVSPITKNHCTLPHQSRRKVDDVTSTLHY